MAKSLILSDDLTDFAHRLFGPDADRFFAGLNTRIRTKIRLSSIKKPMEETIRQLHAGGFTLEPVSWYPIACQYHPGDAYPGQTLEHLLGYFYLQDFSSMLPVLALDPKPGERILDLAAAPGSKTTQIAQHMKNTGYILANDADPGRLGNLAANLDRMGIVNTSVVRNPGEQIGNLLPDFFDKVLIDAPCSALGVIQNKQEVAGWWSYQRMRQFAGLQEKLLISAIKACKPGGLIVYSTCTLTPEENELIINRVLGSYPVDVEPIRFPDGIQTTRAIGTWNQATTGLGATDAIRIYPMETNHQFQGFFVCALRKRVGTERAAVWDPGPVQGLLSAQKTAALYEKMTAYFGIPSDWLNQFALLDRNDLWMVPTHFPEVGPIRDIRSGMRVGRWIGDKLKMTTDFLQLAGGQITKNRADLETESQFNEFMNGGSIPYTEGPTGQRAVFFRNNCLGSGLVQQGKLKCQLPPNRRFNTNLREDPES